MESDVPKIPEQISQLLERRSTFRGWLDQLESRAGDVRPEVYERVRSDYRERLSMVEDELAGHRESLERSLAECRERVSSLEREREEEAAALEEAELRHAVGEYPDEEWEGLRDERQNAVHELEGRLDEEQGAVGRFEEVLEELGAASSAEPAEEERAPDAGAVLDAAALARDFGGEEEEQSAAEPGEHSEAAKEADKDRRDVLAFLGTGTASEASAAEERDEPKQDAHGEDEEESFEDELDFLESLSLEDPSSLDTLSLVLDEGEDEEGEEEAGEDEDAGGKEGGEAS
jgi:hypothetical protein